MELQRTIAAMSAAARGAARAVAKLDAPTRDRALRAIAGGIRDATATIIEANARDLTAATERGLSAAMIDRLRLDEVRLERLAAAVIEIADLPDVIGRVDSTSTRPNGLEVSRVRIPLGVVCMIYESRPNVTADAAALCLKAGNAVILRGGSEAFHSNQALGNVIAGALESAGVAPAAVQVVPFTDRAAIRLLLQRDEDIDLVIPRGGEGLIRYVAEHSRIPVLKHYKGVCHVYVDAAADVDMALAIVENAKVQRPGVCNAAETILVHADIAERFVPAAIERLRACGVEIRGDDRVRELDPGGAGAATTATTTIPATEDDWHAEYLDLIVAMRVVDDLDHAVRHIEQYGSDHTESIVTTDDAAARRFVSDVNSSTVVVNASTRFADGGELGLGAEIGVSTTKLHAYGPMGVEGLTTSKFVVHGTGQLRT